MTVLDDANEVLSLTLFEVPTHDCKLFVEWMRDRVLSGFSNQQPDCEDETYSARFQDIVGVPMATNWAHASFVDCRVDDVSLWLWIADDHAISVELIFRLGSVESKVRPSLTKAVAETMSTLEAFLATNLKWTFGIEHSAIRYEKRFAWGNVLDCGKPGGSELQVDGLHIGP
jgi:hypothetical protein